MTRETPLPSPGAITRRMHPWTRYARGGAGIRGNDQWTGETPSMRHCGKATKAIFVLAAVAALVWGPHCASYANPSPPMGIPMAQPPKAWLTKPWTGDSRPFDEALAQLRAEGDRAGNTEDALRRIRERERVAAQRQPLNLLAHVRWLWAASRVAAINGEFDTDALITVAALDPGIYRTVARTRFGAVMNAGQNSTHPELHAIGARLVASDPSDVWLRSHYIRDLAQGRATLPQAVALSDVWEREAPDSPKVHAVRAAVAMRQWTWSHKRDRAAAQRVVAEYREFIRLSPPTDKDIGGANDLIALVSAKAGLRPSSR